MADAKSVDLGHTASIVLRAGGQKALRSPTHGGHGEPRPVPRAGGMHNPRLVLLPGTETFPLLPAPCPPLPSRQAPAAAPEHRPPCAFVFLCLAGDSPGNTTRSPTPERPPTPVGTWAPAAQGARPAPPGPPPRLNLSRAVRVLCETDKVAVAIQRRFLQQESIPESALYLGHPSCNVSDSNSTHVILVAAWSECGTVVQSVRPGSDPPRGAGRGHPESGSPWGRGWSGLGDTEGSTLRCLTQ